MSLTPDERASFEANGYLHKPGFFNAATIDAVDEEIVNLHDRMAESPVEGVGISWEDFEDEDLPKRIRQLMHSELVSQTLNAMLRSNTALDVIGSLVGPDISLYHSKLLMKAANDGTAIPWHQDYAYWKKEGNRPLMVNCMVSIDRTDEENGCTEFVDGSHHWGLQEHQREQTSFGVFLPGHYQPRDDATAIPMGRGDAIFFNALVIHGSAPNTSDRDRRANTFAYNVTGNGESQCREVLRGRPL